MKSNSATIRSTKSPSRAELNVVLTSVERRGYLVKYFKDVIGGRGVVIATNSHPDATGMIAADIGFVVPRANEPGFIDALLDICSRHSVKLLLSLNDGEAALSRPGTKASGTWERFRSFPIPTSPKSVLISGQHSILRRTGIVCVAQGRKGSTGIRLAAVSRSPETPVSWMNEVRLGFRTSQPNAGMFGGIV
jgi:hypothetical protein